MTQTYTDVMLVIPTFHYNDTITMTFLKFSFVTQTLVIFTFPQLVTGMHFNLIVIPTFLNYSIELGP